jgi:two-component system, OmpR family, response regulator
MKPLRHVMCVDDDEDILEIAKLSLQMTSDLNVSCCGGGLEALGQVPILNPDLVLLDVMMPQMDGPATFVELRKISNVPVIFLTARVQGSDVGEYLGLGAIGVLPKPFDPVGLHAQINRLWEKSQKAEAP